MGWSRWIGHTGVLLSPVPANFTFQGAPATVRRSPDNLNIYARGDDNTLQQFQWHRGDGFSWWATHTDGGLLTAAPAAGSIGPDQEHVMVRGLDGRLWWKEWREGRGWAGWSPLGGTTTFLDSPAVLSRNPDVINVYARGSDNSLMQIFWERGRGWLPAWQTHTDGGRISAAPSVISLGSDHEAVFVRGLDGRLWWKEWRASSGWSAWSPLGSSTTFLDSPAAVSRNPDVMNVYARATDNSLIQIFWERERGWQPEWQPHPDGRISAAPSAVALDGDTEMVFVRGLDNKLWHKWWHRDGVLTVSLHFKYVDLPSNHRFTTGQAIAATELVYAGALVSAQVLSVEQLNNPGLLDINVGACVDWGLFTTFNFGQTALFSNRNGAGPNDIVVYFVRSASGFAGCAVSPDATPGVIVAQGASAWVASHEVGHKVGEGHNGSTDHIMFRVDSNTNLPPNLQVLGPNRFIRRV
jgi:hypothetical protein